MWGSYIYWISTGLLVLLYAASAISYLTKPAWARDAIAGLGYPRSLFWILTTAKVLAIAALLARVSPALTDLAYAGAFFHLLLSASAHFGVRKPKGAVPALIGLVLLVASFSTQNVARDVKSAYAPLGAPQIMQEGVQ